MSDINNQPRVKFAATVKNLDTNEFFIRIEFRGIDEHTKSLTVPRADSRLPTRILAALDNAGALLPQDKDSALALVKDALAKTPTVQEFTTRRVGWRDKSFVLPDRTIGAGKGKLFFRSDLPDLPARSGKLRNYREGLREPCAASPYLLFSIAVIFAGPLLALINRGEGAMFNFVGESSSGKTLCCRAAQSVLKGAGSLELTAASLSPRGLEETAFASNDCGLIIDDLGKMKGSLADRAQTIW